MAKGKKKTNQATPPRHWLVKTEPECFSIDDLEQAPRKTTCWDGVRNYQARNMLRDEMKLGDRVLVYHSSADPPAVVGVAEVVREGYPDATALDPKSDHYDPTATKEEPRWYMVDLRLSYRFLEPIPLAKLKATPELEGMELLRKGSRLSVQPVSPEHYDTVFSLAKKQTR